MLRKSAAALAAIISLAAGAGDAHADATSTNGVAFHAAVGANEAVLTRSQLGNYIANTSGSAITVIASPERMQPTPGPNQTVTINYQNSVAQGSCTVRSATPSGASTTSITKTLLPADSTVSYTFSNIEAPAGNSFVIYCQLGANSATKIYNVTVSP